jgi:hypothetical protein
MALTALLQFGDNESKNYSADYNVADCHCHFMRHYNHFHPDADALCERVELVVVAPGKDNLNLFDWYISGTPLSGRLVFDLSDIRGGEYTSSKELLFEDAYCFSLAEEFHIGSLNRRQLRMSFVAESIIVNGVEYKNLLR